MTNHSEPIITTDQSLSTNPRSVTQEFLVGLQENFPSTIPTVNRTGDKLTIASGADTDHDTDDTDLCCMCGSSLDTDADSCHNALQATQVSHPHQSVTNQLLISDQSYFSTAASSHLEEVRVVIVRSAVIKPKIRHPSVVAREMVHVSPGPVSQSP